MSIGKVHYSRSSGRGTRSGCLSNYTYEADSRARSTHTRMAITSLPKCYFRFACDFLLSNLFCTKSGAVDVAADQMYDLHYDKNYIKRNGGKFEYEGAKIFGLPIFSTDVKFQKVRTANHTHRSTHPSINQERKIYNR